MAFIILALKPLASGKLEILRTKATGRLISRRIVFNTFAGNLAFLNGVKIPLYGRSTGILEIILQTHLNNSYTIAVPFRHENLVYSRDYLLNHSGILKEKNLLDIQHDAIH